MRSQPSTPRTPMPLMPLMPRSRPPSSLARTHDGSPVIRAIPLLALLLLAVLCAPATLLAQAPDPTGHWEGEITLPPGPLVFDVDLAQEEGTWTGDITIPAQNARDVPLQGVAVEGDSVRFTISGIPGEPTFRGMLMEGGSRVEGTFTQGGQTFDFQMSRGEPSAAAAEALEDLEAWAAAEMERWKVPGMAVAVVKDGEVVLQTGYGVRDRESDAPVTARTLFPIGSSTKAFTTFAMGQLADEGALDLDEPVVSYLPRFRLEDEWATMRLTPRDMVTHRSGLPRHDLAWYGNERDTRAELVGRLAAHTPNRELREQWQYNNMMFLTAGYLVEELSGMTWEQFVEARIFEPLGMERSGFSVDVMANDPDAAAGYGEREDTLVRIPYRDIDVIGPAGSINSSVEEMTRWLQVQLGQGAVDGSRLIQGPTLREMHTPQMAIPAFPSDPALGPQSYGMGWFIDTYRGHYRVQHGGNIDGFSALVSLFPFDGLGVVVLTNKNGTPLPEFAVRQVADRVLDLEPRDWSGETFRRQETQRESADEADEEVAEARVEGTEPSHPLDDYVGRYDHPGYGVLRVERRGEGLEMAFHEMEAPLEHWHYDVFRAGEGEAPSPLEDIQLHFRMDAGGAIVSVEVQVEPLLPPRTFVKMPPERMTDPDWLARLEGSYLVDGVQPAEIRLRGDELTASLPNQPLYRLVPRPDGSFELDGMSGFTVRFQVPETGDATGFTLAQPNGVFTAERAEEEEEGTSPSERPE